MSGFAELSVISKLLSSQKIWRSVIDALAEQNSTTLSGPSSTGANVFLCSEEGPAVVLHEVVARQFTTLFDLIDGSSEENLRDPFGNYIFIFQGLSNDILEGVRDVLYTGSAYLTNYKSKQAVLNLLNQDLMFKPHMQSKKQSPRGQKPKISKPYQHR